MATFTTISRGQLDWEAPPPVQAASASYYINIGSGYNLLIADSYKLLISPTTTQTTWTGTSKTQVPEY